MNGLLALSSIAVAGWFAAVWQGCVLAAVVALGLRLVPRLGAAARSAVWLALFVLLVGLHLVPFLTTGHIGAVGAEKTPAVELDARWSLVVLAAWGIFSMLRALQLVVSVVKLRRLAAEAVIVEPAAELVPLLTRRNGRQVPLCVSNDVERPCVLGFLRPRVLLPIGLKDALSADELALVVAHEMEHLRRADDWTNLLQKLALVVFPLNPAMAWVEKRLCAERELACDDRAMRTGRGAKAYALCLARLAELSMMRSGLALALGAWDRRPELLRRIERIVTRPARVLEGRLALMATSAVLAMAAVAAVGLMRTPAVVGFASGMPHVPEAHAELKSLPAASPLAQERALPVKEAVAAKRAARPVEVPVVTADAVMPETQPEMAGVLVLTGLEEFQAPARTVVTTYDERTGAPQLIYAVEQYHRTRYAAVPVLGGWIIVQI